MDMILETADLCKSFKSQIAVNKVSLHIKKNSVYGLLGPNWGGKVYHFENGHRNYAPHLRPHCI